MMDNNTEEIKFRLNPEFYSQHSIVSTLEAFKDICEGHFDKQNSLICLKPKTDANPERLAYEFCNYCLSLMK